MQRDGRELWHYAVPLPGREPPLTLNAWVDKTSGQVESLSLESQRAGQPYAVAELQVLAVNQPVAAENFVVRDTLTADGRVGTITETQGIVTLKPATHERWTAICSKTLVRPGDWLRTDNRGANAVVVQLVKESQLILGPGTLVEIVSPTQVRVHTGELEAVAGAGDTLTLVGPGNVTLAVGARPAAQPQVFRVQNEQLARLEHEPTWLKGFKSAVQGESLGSLVALVDGRNVPLSVGFHKVQVEIRDQIARTVIEESFVNHTAQILEGVFYFPLPDDASISGFGMWIGDELVEADIVEKQRAREIFETILRERRDPGLLEWTGGNLFKARVFPIPAEAEKRVRISYTQVLPARGNTYRYAYALQSELLKLHPLRELSIDVQIHSATGIKKISSPTHMVRSDRTEHSGRVEFSAQEYTPTRDFEVVVETDRRQSDLVVIPHRRGNDGYFMLQLTPPATGDWSREIVPDGEPLDVLILADTSASLDQAQRRKQAEVVAALLASLSPRDTVNLAGCDVECSWVFEKSVAAEAQSVQQIRTFLERRTSLGWTDLDQAFAAAFARATPRTHIVYIGDGIVTTGDARPEGFALRVQQAYRGIGTCHAIALGSAFEATALKAMSSLGGGSFRKLSGDEGPAVVASGLLKEIARPALRNVKVEFRGFQAARVYPEVLPNLPAGSQQILLGLYRPGSVSGDQQGEVVVTATQEGRPVRFTAPISFRNDDEGNSFIPRLWARRHLDSLLAQGAAPAIREDVIALSEEFQIMTPYTSFLVLESDADRQRFKVQRRFRMRDGEKYFQEGRDQARFDLVQQQKRRAGDWRLGLRRSSLLQFRSLGRDSLVLNRQPGVVDERWRFRLSSTSAVNWYGNGTVFDMNGNGPFGDEFLQREVMIGQRLENLEVKSKLNDDADESGLPAPGALPAEPAGFGGEGVAESWDGLAVSKRERDSRDKDNLPIDLFEEFEGMDGRSLGANSRLDLRKSLGREDAWYFDEPQFGTWGPGGMGGGARGAIANGRKPRFGLFDIYDRRWNRSMDHVATLGSLFPRVPLPVRPSTVPSRTPEWPEAIRALSNSLLRNQVLSQLPGGLEITRVVDRYEPRWNEMTERTRRVDLYLRDQWLTRVSHDDAQTLLHWADARERGVSSLAFGLGQVRKSQPADLTPVSWEQTDLSYLGALEHALVPLHETYRNYVPTVERQGDDRALLILRLPRATQSEIRFVIDTTRHVLLSAENREQGKVTRTERFTDFVEVAGLWWATRSEVLNDQGQPTVVMTRKVTAVDREQLLSRWQEERAVWEHVLTLQLPVPGIKAARRALNQPGRATFEDHFVLLLQALQTQQWSRVFEHWQHCERLAADKPGIRWIRAALQMAGRRHVELKTALNDEGDRLARGEWYLGKRPAPAEFQLGDEFVLVTHLVGLAERVSDANELLRFLDLVRPVYARQPGYRNALLAWGHRRINSLNAAGQPDTVIGELRQMATGWPRDYATQQQYAQTLFNQGDYDAAYAWLKQALSSPVPWQGWEADSMRGTYASFLHQQGRYADLVDYLEEWVKQSPTNQSVCQQLLAALVLANQIERYNARMAEWLKPGLEPAELSPAAEARIAAVISMATGNGSYFYTNRVEQKWVPTIHDVALATIKHRKNWNLAQQILGHWQLQQAEDMHRVRAELTPVLVARLPTANAEQLQLLINWVRPQVPSVTQETWRAVVSGLRARWVAETDVDERHALGGVLLSVLPQAEGDDAYEKFLREQLAEGPAVFRATYARQLFDRLLSQPWTAARENEAFSLLDQLTEGDDPAQRLRSQVTTLYRLTDALVEGRYRAAMLPLEQSPEHTLLAVREQKKVAAQNLQQARRGFADRLRQEAARKDAAFAPWWELEWSYLEILADHDLPAVTAKVWELLAAAADSAAEPDQEQVLWADEPVAAVSLKTAFMTRCEATLMFLAMRPQAAPEQVKRLKDYLDRKIATDVDPDQGKLLKFHLLVALDETRELRESLLAWMNGDDADNRWRLALGYVLAEQGAVPEAIALFAGVELSGDLGPQAYRALAGWYQAANRRADYDRARIRSFQTVEEWQLSRQIGAHLNAWQRAADRPNTLDEQVPLMFQALFEKASQPQNYLSQLQQFYQATRDFRLLAALADSLSGHTPGQVYAIVNGMQRVVSEIRDEAVADELVLKLTKVRDDSRSAVDRRACDLLLALVERRASEVRNQPGPHIAAAKGALQRAFEQEWTEGEERLMAEWLSNLGTISQPELAAEQMRQLQELHRRQARRSYDRLHIARYLAIVWNQYDRADDAIGVLKGELSEFQEAQRGVLPVSANGPLETLISIESSRQRFALAESTLLDQLRHPVHGQQRAWLEQKLFEVYHQTLQNDGSVTFGTGAALYVALEKRLVAALQSPDQNYRSQVVHLICSVYRTAAGKQIPGVREALRTFATRQMPDVLAQSQQHYTSMANTVAYTLRDLVDTRTGLAFLIEAIEHEPAWWKFTYQDGWSQFAYLLGNWRTQVADLGDLDARLLKIVLNELRHDLEARNQRSRTIYYGVNDPQFWTAKAADFARTAEEVYRAHEASGPAVQYVAEYLFHGLGRTGRAIEMLLTAHRAKRLDGNGFVRLIEFLIHDQRFGEIVALLEPVVTEEPGNLSYRLWLMQAYFRTNRPAQLRALLADTDKRFHEDHSWTEGVLAQLAESCLQNELWEDCVKYYQELIPRYEQSHARRGVGDGTLSNYYSYLARAHSRLNQTALAVDAACGAVVASGQAQRDRTQVINGLRTVLVDCTDLAAYVETLDRQVESTGTDRPIVRKVLGEILLERGQFPQAIAQLQRAAVLEPNDPEIRQKLVECFDRQQDPVGAINQLLAQAEVNRRDMALFKSLGERYAKLEQPREAERARTSIVDILPSEAESHQLLAEMFQEQNRWTEAVTQWEQVARIREAEPTGWLGLAGALIQVKQPDRANGILRKLETTTWPERFADVPARVQELRQKLMSP
ncbi:MAG: hypothetical protein JSS02_25905 [Planctomycetes bacterium]|nr:hypothetical protein [Planctomycetota bacterium]